MDAFITAAIILSGFYAVTVYGASVALIGLGLIAATYVFLGE